MSIGITCTGDIDEKMKKLKTFLEVKWATLKIDEAEEDEAEGDDED